jgi:hypothetical protein
LGSAGVTFLFAEVKKRVIVHLGVKGELRALLAAIQAFSSSHSFQILSTSQ